MQLCPQGMLILRNEDLTSNTVLPLQSTSSVQISLSVVSDSLWPHRRQHASLPWPSSTPRACSNLCPSENLIILHYQLCVWDILCIISKILGQIWTKWNTRLFSVLNRQCSLSSNNLKLFLVFIMGIIYVLFFCWCFSCLSWFQLYMLQIPKLN